MREDSYKILEQKSGKNKIIFRWILFIILGIFALYYITPLYVMIVTSFKTMDEIRQGNIFYLPDTLYFEPWLEAWRGQLVNTCLLYTSPSPRDATLSRMPSSA